MRIYFQQAFRALIILLFALFIIKLHYTGDILKLINPKYSMLSQIGVVILIILFVAQIQRIWAPSRDGHSHDHSHDGHSHDHGYSPVNGKKLVSYSIIIFPLFTGIFFPLTTLDASIANKKGAMLSITNNAMNQAQEQSLQDDTSLDSSEDQDIPTNENDTEVPDEAQVETEADTTVENSTPVDPNERDPNVDSNKVSEEEYQSLVNDLRNQSEITMSNQMYATYYEEISKDLAAFEGKEISLQGFVYKEEGFANNQLVLARFLITHCVADASIIGFLSEFDDANAIEQDTWLEAKGTIVIQDYNGVQLPMIKVSEWKEIEEPNQPYLYPLTIKAL